EVDHAHAARHGVEHEVGADEAGTAGDQPGRRHAALRRRRTRPAKGLPATRERDRTVRDAIPTSYRPPSAGMACRPRAWPAGDAPPARLRTGGAASGWTARATPTRGQAWERKAPLVRSSLVKHSAFFLHLRIP